VCKLMPTTCVEASVMNRSSSSRGGTNFGKREVVRIVLRLCPLHQLWNLSLWDGELACFFCY